MAGLLRPGAESSDAQAWRASQREAADFVVDFAAGGYGPHGAAKLLVGAEGEGRWVRSPALALRESATGPLLAPYADLATRLHKHAGDQCTAGLLLAARLVKAALANDAPPVAGWLGGYALAWRQAKAWLAAHTDRTDPSQALTAVAPPDWVAAALSGLAELADEAGDLDLDRIDVRAEPEGPAWLPGVVVTPKETPSDPGPVRVLLLATGWNLKARSEGMQATARDPSGLAALGQQEEARRGAVVTALKRLGVGLVACGGALDEGLRDRLHGAGIAVCTDVAKGTMARVASSTGAEPVARLEEVHAADLGKGTLVRRPRRGWLLQGQGPSATFVVAAESGPARDDAVEQAERLLRAAGLVLAKPGALPGGGRWQRGLAASLRAAADAAPGHAPIAMAGAAQAIDALADDLLRNAGADALAGGLLGDAEAVSDPAACVRLAVDGAFETAIAILRLDGAYARRSSTATDLRGGTGPAGSLRGMPGDIPPLM